MTRRSRPVNRRLSRASTAARTAPRTTTTPCWTRTPTSRAWRRASPGSSGWRRRWSSPRPARSCAPAGRTQASDPPHQLQISPHPNVLVATATYDPPTPLVERGIGLAADPGGEAVHRRHGRPPGLPRLPVCLRVRTRLPARPDLGSAGRPLPAWWRLIRSREAAAWKPSSIRFDGRRCGRAQGLAVLEDPRRCRGICGLRQRPPYYGPAGRLQHRSPNQTAPVLVGDEPLINYVQPAQTSPSWRARRHHQARRPHSLQSRTRFRAAPRQEHHGQVRWPSSDFRSLPPEEIKRILVQDHGRN